MLVCSCLGGSQQHDRRLYKISITFRGQGVQEEWTVVQKARTCNRHPQPAGRISCREYVYLPCPLGQTLLCVQSLLMLHVWSMQAHTKLVLLRAMQQTWWKGNLFCGHITALLAFMCLPVLRMGGPVHKMKIPFQRKFKFSTWDAVSWNYFIEHYQQGL